MRAYWQLTLAQLRIFARNRQVLFFTLLFPLILMLALGSFAGKNGGVSLALIIVDHDDSLISKEVVELFVKNKAIKVTQSNNLKAARKSLKNGDVQLVLELPKGSGEQLKKIDGGDPAAKLPLYYSETNLSAAEIGITVVKATVDEWSKKRMDYQPIVEIESEGVRSLDVQYIDFLVPGIVAMMIMSNNMNGVAGQIAAWRERGILRRMQSTRLKASTFIAAQITARLLLNGSQALLVLLVANLIFGVKVNGSWLALIGIVVLGTLAFMALGFIIAGVAKNPESAGPIAGLATFPMLFLGGVFFPISSMPEFLQPFVSLLPISHLSTALRETMNIGTPIVELWGDIGILAAWAIVAFMIASRTFRWE